METKYKLGQEISVEFYGTIKSVRLERSFKNGVFVDNIVYDVEGFPSDNMMPEKGYQIREDSIYEIAKPEDFKKN